MSAIRANGITKRLVAAMACLCLVLGASMASCQKSEQGEWADVLTQKAISDDRLQITILVKYAFAIDGFERAVEERFPSVDIVQVGNYTHDMGIDEYEKRLERRDLTDIVMTWPYNIGEQYWGEALLDLAGMGFSSRYNISDLNELSRGGKLYYLPGPAQVRGIVYNKTLFEERGWEVPDSFNGFVELCRTIEGSGMRSLQLGLKNAEVLDTAFIGYGYADCCSTSLDARWIKEYNENKRGSFGDHFEPALETFQALIDEGILKESDLEVDYSQREKMLFTRECAMAEDSVLMARMGEDQTGTTDEFALMPFFNPGDGGDWARLYPVCYIGLSKVLAEQDSQEKYDAVMEIMDYISTPEGQEALMLDTGAMFSSLNGMGAPQVPEIDDMKEALEEGRYGVFPELTYAQEALREGLAGMVRGDLTAEDVVRMVDEQNAVPASDADENDVLGSATEDFSTIETGSFVTDAMRSTTGADIALFLDNGKDGAYNGKGISAKFYKGDVTAKDVLRVLPDLKHGDRGAVQKASMTGASLLNALEYSIAVDNDQVGCFYYFSGLRVEFDPTALPGKRIQAIETADGSPVDPDAIYSVAISDNSVNPEYCLDCVETGTSVFDVVSDAVKDAGVIAPPKDGRFTVVRS